MRTVLRVAGWALGVLVLVPVFAVLAAIALLNIDPGRRLVERLAGQLTGGQVVIAGLGGRFPDALRLAHAEVRDAGGAWLTLDGVALDWSPLALLHREARIDLLSAQDVDVRRLPKSEPSTTPAKTDSQPFSLPVRVSVRALHVARATIGAPVAGVGAVLALDGSASLASLDDGTADVTIDRLDSPGGYEVHGKLTPTRLDAALKLREPAGGLVAAIAKLPDIGALALDASVAGPRTAERTALTLAAGPLRAKADGTVDLSGQSADLDVTAAAPAMTPAPGVQWQSVALDAHVHGPFRSPDANGHLLIAGLAAGGAAVAKLSAELQGNAGAASLTASAEGVRIPGPDPALLAAAPVQLTASVRLDTPTRPVTFKLVHPLLSAAGQAETSGTITVHADLTAPDLHPLAALGGVDLQGRAALTVGLALPNGATDVTVDGTVGVTGGMSPVPALLGDAATLGATVSLAGNDITVSRAVVHGRAIDLTANGTDKAGTLDMAATVKLPDLAVAAPSVAGSVTLAATAKGPLAGNGLAVDATVTGDVATAGFPRSPVQAAIHATGLPGAPAGTVTADGRFEGAPLALSVRADRTADGTLHATIDRAEWKSLHADGAITLPPGSKLPDGTVSLRIARLDDLRTLSGQALSGSLTAEAALDDHTATLTAEATRAGIPGSSVGHLALKARVADPTTRPVVNATLDATGIEAGGIGGAAKVAVAGPQEALAIKLNAGLTGLAGAPATVAGAATLNVPAKTVQLASLTADWKGEALRLLAPAKVAFGDGVAVDRLRIGLQQAVLEVAGRVTPALNLQASLRGVTPDLAKPFVPGLNAAGQIGAEARLTGTVAAPQGTVRLTATGLRVRSGPGAGLPAADLTATAQLAGKQATVDARLHAGRSDLTVTGRAPLGVGPLALRAQGGVDLALLNPVLSPGGREVRGQLALNAAIGGTLAAPDVNGTVTLANGEVQDFGQGVRVTNIAALIEAAGQTIRITRLTGQAGAGTISVTGSVGLAGAKPVDVAIIMRNARPLSSDLLTAVLNADLTARGDLSGPLTAAGRVDIVNATINIPEHFPTSVAVLPVRIAGQPPAPPPTPGPVVRLDLTLNTTGQIFVRGRGLDAILGGNLHVGGTTSSPQVSGAFNMRRGTFNVAGTSLTFAKGRVGFDGAGVTRRIDPSLEFEADANTTSGTASLLVGGYASAPKITLTSSPPLPQDEILAQLLFGRSAAQLGPLQYAEIAAALAQLSGAGSGLNPLDSVRKGLGLDRLTVGGGGNGSTSGASIEAGKYIANGVFLGAKQGTSGTGSQAEVQIDIYKGLKLETDVGTGSTGNSVGLSYQFDY